MPIAVY